MKKITSLFLFFCFLATQALANPIYVAPQALGLGHGQDAQNAMTLEDGIANSDPNDPNATIEMTPGLYQPTGQITLDKNLIIQGTGASDVQVDCQAAGDFCFFMTGDVTVTLRYFKIMNATNQAVSAFFTSSANLTVENMIFENNVYGVIMNPVNGGSLFVARTLFENNSSAGIRVLSDMIVTVERCGFKNNHRGIDFENNGIVANITQSFFRDNSSSGIAVEKNNQIVGISESRFINNRVGVYNEESLVNVSQSFFSNNDRYAVEFYHALTGSAVIFSEFVEQPDYAIYVEYNEYALNPIQGESSLTNNRFTDSYGGIVIVAARNNSTTSLQHKIALNRFIDVENAIHNVGDADSSLIERNFILRSDYGISAVGGSHSTIQNNIVINSGTVGIGSFNAVGTNIPATPLVMYNTVAYGTGYGFLGNGFASVANNIFYRHDIAGISSVGGDNVGYNNSYENALDYEGVFVSIGPDWSVDPAFRNSRDLRLSSSSALLLPQHCAGLYDVVVDARGATRDGIGNSPCSQIGAFESLNF